MNTKNQASSTVDDSLDDFKVNLDKLNKDGDYILKNSENETDKAARLKREAKESDSLIERSNRTHCFMLIVGFLIFILFATLILYYALGCGNERMVEKVMGYLISTSAAILSYLAGTKR